MTDEEAVESEKPETKEPSSRQRPDARRRPDGKRQESASEECPHGLEFGIDCNNADVCQECDEAVFEACGRAFRTLFGCYRDENMSDFDRKGNRMATEEFITPEEAVDLHWQAGFGLIHISTVRNWIPKYKLGIKIAGKWWVNKTKFKKFLKGDYDKKA